MKRFTLLLSAAAAVLLQTACAGSRLEDGKQHAVKVENHAPMRTGYEWVVPQGNGPVLLVADYRHVLTATQPPEYLPVPVRSVEPEPVQTLQPAPVRVEAPRVPQPSSPVIPLPERVTVAPAAHPEDTIKLADHKLSEVANSSPPPPPPREEDPLQRAWKHYCDAGRGLTSEDSRLLAQVNYVIQKEMVKNCLPPK